MYINLFPRSGLMQFNTRNLLWRRDTSVKKSMHARAGLGVSKMKLSEDLILGGSAGLGYSTDGSIDEEDGGGHLPLMITQTQPTTQTTAIGSGVFPPVGTDFPVSSTGSDDEPLTTSTSSAAPGPSSITSSIPAASSTPSFQTPTPSTRGDQGRATTRGSSKMEGLSKGAISGIVIVVLSVILVIGMLVYRKRAIKRRSRVRQTWLPRPFVVETTTTVVTDAPNALEKGAKGKGETGGSGASGGNRANGTILPPPFGTRTIPRVKPPPISLLSIPGLLGSNLAASRHLSSMPELADGDAQRGGHNRDSSVLLSQTYSAPPGGRPRVGAMTNIGVVRCIFEPSMPDELRIRVGEAMRILAEYDDGWGLCENLRGERGVVPLQCLDRGMGEEGGFNESSRPLSGRRAVGL